MPKQAKSSTAKVRQICQEYPDEFSATPARDLRCNLCDVLVKCDKKFFVESHRKSKQHQRKLETKSKSQSKQTFLQLHQVNFKLTSTFSSLFFVEGVFRFNTYYGMQKCINSNLSDCKRLSITTSVFRLCIINCLAPAPKKHNTKQQNIFTKLKQAKQKQ